MAKNANSNVLDFEPSQNTKELWLSTRKEGKSVTGNLTLPGLFETVKSAQDKGLFIFAMVLEVIGFLFISALADWGILIAGTVAALVVIDFFLAVGLHRKQGEICKHSNLAITTYANKPVQSGHIAHVQKLKKWWLGKVCIVLLWVFAIVKASGFYVLNPETYIFSILMFLIYSFIAYVHIYHTGYAIAEWQFRRAYNKEKDKFLEWQISGITTKDPKIGITIIPACREYFLQPNITLQEIQNLKGNDEKGIRADIVTFDNPNWKLITWGLMDDTDLHNLLSGKDNVREYVAVECLKAQLDMLGKNADIVGNGPTLAAIQSKINNTQQQ